jgi:hypothetical protein
MERRSFTNKYDRYWIGEIYIEKINDIIYRKHFSFFCNYLRYQCRFWIL